MIGSARIPKALFKVLTALQLPNSFLH